MREPVRYLCEYARPAGLGHPERRHAAQRRRRGRLPARAGRRWPSSCGEFVDEFGVERRRRLLRHDAGAHPAAASRPCAARRRRRAARVRAAAGDRAHARAVDRSRSPAPMIVGERVNTQGCARSSGCCSPTTTTACWRRARAGRGRRARARRLRGADRARRRGRPDARAWSSSCAHGRRGAAGDRHDRGRRRQGGARDVPRPRDRQLDQPGERPRARSRPCVPLVASTARRSSR